MKVRQIGKGIPNPNPSEDNFYVVLQLLILSDKT